MFGFDVSIHGQRFCNILTDTQAVAQGIYDIMVEDHKTLLAFGMIDHSIVEILDKHLTTKFNELFTRHSGDTPEAFDKFVTSLGLGECNEAVKLRKQFVTTMSTEVSKELYGVANRLGKMIV